jgi:hypothetical protein
MNLTEIVKFEEYVYTLFSNQSDLIIFVTSSDAHTPASGRNRSLNLLRAFGITTDLEKTYRHSWLCVIDSGVLKLERTSVNEKIEAAYSFVNHKAEIISQGYNAAPVINSPVSIKIDGVEYAINKRGLNIVTWNKNTDKVVDSVAFDTLKKTEAIRFTNQSAQQADEIFNRLFGIFANSYSIPQYLWDNGYVNVLIVINNDYAVYFAETAVHFALFKKIGSVAQSV